MKYGFLKALYGSQHFYHDAVVDAGRAGKGNLFAVKVQGDTFVDELIDESLQVVNIACDSINRLDVKVVVLLQVGQSDIQLRAFAVCAGDDVFVFFIELNGGVCQLGLGFLVGRRESSIGDVSAIVGLAADFNLGSSHDTHPELMCSLCVHIYCVQ